MSEPFEQLCTPSAMGGRPVAYRIHLDDNRVFEEVLKGYLEEPCQEWAWTEDCPDSDVSPIIASQAWTKGWLSIERDVAQIGTVLPTAAAAIPDYALACDGATYMRVDYPELYAALDTAFIVDADHFRVPDLAGRVVIGDGTGGGPFSYAVGDTGGEATHTLTIAEMPSHSHSYTSPLLSGTATPPPLDVALPNPIPSSTGSTGGDGAHENRQPYLALRWYIVYA